MTLMACVVILTIASVSGFAGVAPAQTDAQVLPVGPFKAESGARATVNGGVVQVQDSAGWLRTERLYSDFVLQFDFRLLNKDSEGGVLIRSWFGYGNKNPPYRGYRIALGDKVDGAVALARIGSTHRTMTGVTFDRAAVATAKRPVGEWQECEVRVEGTTLTVLLNGVVASVAHDLEELTGYIGLQTRRNRIEFRNVRARRLPFAHQPFGTGAHAASERGVQAPRVLRRTVPSYPAEPLDAKVQGSVRLELVVSHDGSVGDVRVTRPLHPDLDEAAVACVRQWRFQPGILSGEAVPVIVTVDVAFSFQLPK